MKWSYIYWNIRTLVTLLLQQQIKMTCYRNVTLCETHMYHQPGLRPALKTSNLIWLCKTLTEWCTKDFYLSFVLRWNGKLQMATGTDIWSWWLRQCLRSISLTAKTISFPNEVVLLCKHSKTVTMYGFSHWPVVRCLPAGHVCLQSKMNQLVKCWKWKALSVFLPHVS